MVNPAHFRIGNWIHRKGSSRYGIVNGDLLALLEKDEKLCKEFNGVELTDNLLIKIGFQKRTDDLYRFGIFWICRWENNTWFWCDARGVDIFPKAGIISDLHTLQNKYFALICEELPLPESAKIIPELSPNNP